MRFSDVAEKIEPKAALGDVDDLVSVCRKLVGVAVHTAARVAGKAEASVTTTVKELVVLPTDVVNAADRGAVSERAVWSSPVVVVEPVWQRLVALVV